ncbi:MAG: inverse autotransporter beta domain-containing protein [Chlamydiia bacterium]
MNLQADSPPDEICGTGPKPMRITTRHIEGNGIGYNRGYTTIEGFLAPYQYDRWIPFVDLRGHVLNDGQLAANAGLGVRYKSDARIWGINSYYDYRNSRHYHYNQVAMGLESLGTVWDFRLNGYLPVGAKTSHAYGWEDDTLQGYYWMLKAKREFAMRGISGEAGFHVDHFRKFPLYFAAGPYYLQGKGDPAWGGQIRAAVEVSETLRVEGNTSYDNRFKWIGQGQISLIIPLGHKKKVKKTNGACSRVMALEKRALQKVDRFEIIPVDTQKRTAIAVDPSTGMPYFISNVDSGGNSDGRAENPFAQLSDALEQIKGKPGGIAYVYGAGFNHAFDANEEGRENGYTLSAGNQLLGAGRGHTLQTQHGSLVLNPRGTNPQLINSRTDSPLDPSVVLNMEENTKVSAALISGTTGVGIQSAGYSGGDYVAGIDIQNVVVNLITLGANQGIRVKGSSKINKTLINSRSFNDDVTGIDLQGSGSMSRSLVRAQTRNGRVIGILSKGVDVVGNRVTLETQSGEAVGVDLTTDSDTEITSASNNTISITSGTDVYGIKATFTSNEASVDLENNEITINSVTGDAKGIFIYIPEDFSDCSATIGSTSEALINIATIGDTANAYGIYSITNGDSSTIKINSVPMKSITTQSSNNANKACGIYSEGSGSDCTLTITSADIQGVQAPLTSAYGLYISPSPGLALTIQNSAQIKTDPSQTAYSIYIDKNTNALKNLQIKNNKGVIATSTSGDVYGIYAPIWKNCTTSVSNNTISITSGTDVYGIKATFTSNEASVDLENNEITINSVTGDAKGIFIYIPEDFSDCSATIGSTSEALINIATIGDTANAYGIYSITNGDSSTIKINSVPMKSITTQSSNNANKACGIYSEGSGSDCTLTITSADIQGVQAPLTSAYGLYISPSPGLALTIQNSAQIKTDPSQTAYSIYIDKNTNALKNLQITNNKGVIANSTSGDVYGIYAPIWKGCTTSVGHQSDVYQIITVNSTDTENPGKAYGIYLSFADDGDNSKTNHADIGGNTIIISTADAAYAVYTDWENREFCSVSVLDPSSSPGPYYSCKATNDVSLVYGKGGSNNSMDVYIDTTYYKSQIQSTSGLTRGVYLEDVYNGKIILKTDLYYSNCADGPGPSSSVSNTADSTNTCCSIEFPTRFRSGAGMDLINQSSDPNAFTYYLDEYVAASDSIKFPGNDCEQITSPCD